MIVFAASIFSAAAAAQEAAHESIALDANPLIKSPAAASLAALKTAESVSLGTSSPACRWGCVRPLDQIWVISTRGLGCPSGMETPNFLVQRQLPDGSWASSSFDEFVAANAPTVPALFALHGNQVDASLAISQGLRLYRQITAGLPEGQPVQFVIWSWPSERIHGIIKDVRLKAARTTTESKYLAWTMSQFDPQTPMSLVGFSFGARIATGALHVLAGGSLNGYALPAAAVARRPVRAVLVASALRNSWLAQGAYHGRALEIVDSMLLVNNSCDAALKRYHVAESCRDAEALGYTGPVGWSPHYNRIRQVDACCDLGKSHDWERYIASPRYASLMRQYAWPVSAIESPMGQAVSR